MQCSGKSMEVRGKSVEATFGFFGGQSLGILVRFGCFLGVGSLRSFMLFGCSTRSRHFRRYARGKLQCRATFLACAHILECAGSGCCVLNMVCPDLDRLICSMKDTAKPHPKQPSRPKLLIPKCKRMQLSIFKEVLGSFGKGLAVVSGILCCCVCGVACSRVLDHANDQHQQTKTRLNDNTPCCSWHFRPQRPSRRPPPPPRSPPLYFQ